MSLTTKTALEHALDNFTTSETKMLALHVMHGLVTHSMMLSALESPKSNEDIAAEARAHARMLKIIEQEIGRPTSGHFNSPLQGTQHYVTPQQLEKIRKADGQPPTGRIMPSGNGSKIPILPPPQPTT